MQFDHSRTDHSRLKIRSRGKLIEANAVPRSTVTLRGIDSLKLATVGIAALRCTSRGVRARVCFVVVLTACAYIRGNVIVHGLVTAE